MRGLDLAIQVLKYKKLEMATNYTDRPDNKRPRQGSEDTNTSAEMCQRCEYAADKTITCSGCKLNFCTDCAKISNTLFKCLIEGELNDFHWSCKSCKACFPTLQNIAGTLEEIQKRHENRMDHLETRMGNIENTTKKEVEVQVQSLKSDILESLKSDINTVVDERTRELDDRKRRESNITIFNLPEHSHDNGADNKRADEEDILEIFSDLGLQNPSILNLFCLGKKVPTKYRPLKVILDSKTDRKFLLENAKYIIDKTAAKFHRIIIAKDLTPEQRRERREKIVARRHAQRGNGDSRSGNGQDRLEEAAQFPLSEPEALEMQVEHLMPSPIPVEQPLQFPHYNTNTSSVLSQASAYDQSTVINVSSTDVTMPGGISTQDIRPQSPSHPGQFNV